MSTVESPQVLSLLWPDGIQGEGLPGKSDGGRDWEADLDLDEFAKALDIDGRHAARIRSVLLELCNDPVVIYYRQEVLEDFLNSPKLSSRLESVLPMMAELGRFGANKRWEQNPLLQTVRRLEELALYVDAVGELHAIFEEESSSVSSEALVALHRHLAAVVEEESFQSLAAQIPELRASLEGLASVTIGVNLDAELRPVEATLLSINPQKFTGESLVNRLLGIA